MSIVTRDVWHCDECGHEWTITAGVVPEQCASKKCRTRKWNSGMTLERPEPVRQKEPEPVKVKSGPIVQAQGCKECGSLSGHQKWCSKR